MIQLKIDDTQTEISPEKWSSSRVGELVHHVYEELPQNRIITRVLINGTPLQGNEQEQDIPVLEDTAIEIRTADKSMWEANGLETCLSSLERVQTSLIRTAELFRADERGRANRFFAQCIESLERFLESMTITRVACKMNFNTILVDGFPLTKVEDALTQILKSVLESQEKQSYEELADKIEFELITNLYHWKTALQNLQRSRQSNS